jgi:MFS family permease
VFNTAFLAGAERAFIAENAPADYKGTVLGFYGMLQGIGLLFSSIIAGVLWTAFGSNAMFYFGGALGIISAVLIAVMFRGKRKGQGEKLGLHAHQPLHHYFERKRMNSAFLIAKIFGWCMME